MKKVLDAVGHHRFNSCVLPNGNFFTVYKQSVRDDYLPAVELTPRRTLCQPGRHTQASHRKRTQRDRVLLSATQYKARESRWPRDGWSCRPPCTNGNCPSSSSCDLPHIRTTPCYQTCESPLHKRRACLWAEHGKKCDKHGKHRIFSMCLTVLFHRKITQRILRQVEYFNFLKQEPVVIILKKTFALHLSAGNLRFLMHFTRQM